MHSIWARATIAGTAILALMGVTSCGNDQPDDAQRRSVTFSETYGEFTVYLDDNNRATGMAIEDKGADSLDLRATILKSGQAKLPYDADSATAYNCAAKQSPCTFDKPQPWKSLMSYYSSSAREYQNPHWNTYTDGLRCGRGGCNLLIQRDTFTAKLFMGSSGELVRLHLLDASKNFHLNIELEDGRDVDCIIPECRIWHEDGTDRTVLAKADDSGMTHDFTFKQPLDWEFVSSSDEGGLDPQRLSRRALVLGSAGQMTMPKGGN